MGKGDRGDLNDGAKGVAGDIIERDSTGRVIAGGALMFNDNFGFVREAIMIVVDLSFGSRLIVLPQGSLPSTSNEKRESKDLLWIYGEEAPGFRWQKKVNGLSQGVTFETLDIKQGGMLGAVQ